jgi:hypothetical protein
VRREGATLLHELWEYTEDGGTLCTFCHAGPRGDGARRTLPPDAGLVWSVWAGSHFEAMTLYYEHQDWGRYTTDHASDHEPYPEAWVIEQRNYLTSATNEKRPS